MTTTANLHALAQARAACAQRVADLGENADAAAIAEAHRLYQEAEDTYQRALSTMTNFELIEAGLKP
jgi:hypothetical protein